LFQIEQATTTLRMRARKSSLRISLVLVGVAALAGCDEAPDAGPQYARRDVYASLDDCQKDWGRPEQCDPVPGSSSGGGIRYYGPWYGDTSARTGARPGSRAVDSVHVTRGGFGASSSFHSSGG
jgi:uncharacterized protein YgiB involved in biofilm formation